ncbi:MAG: type II toxin-antitoxin system RelE/ParE family toxin [Eubacteriales bacterium]|nr:type II toxin-antitoxin system RelE/ParE family toxin [Eubacteriales bacterium]
MNYEVHITRAAENDLNEAADYIEFVLLNPQAADDLLDTVEETLPTLAQYAQRYALVDDPVLRAWGIRFVQIKNYLAFYTISEEEQKVYIVRFLYGKRNWISILKNGFSME